MDIGRALARILVCAFFGVFFLTPTNARADVRELLRLFGNREASPQSQPAARNDLIQLGSTQGYENALREAIQECSRRGFRRCTEFNRMQIRRFVGDPRDNVVVTEFHVSVRGEMIDASRQGLPSGENVCGAGSAESNANRLIAALGGVSSEGRNLLVKFCNQQLPMEGILKLAGEVAAIAEKQRTRDLSRFLAARGLEEILQKSAGQTALEIN